jgi:D-inositol-3-phosphate glycosyltransferase
MACTGATEPHRGHIVLISLHADPATAPGAGEGGGTHSYLREIMVGLAATDLRLTLLTRWADPRLSERERVSTAIEIVRLRIGAVDKFDKRNLDDMHFASLVAVRRVLAETCSPMLLHSVYWNSGRVAMDLAEEIGVPFVHTVISNGWRRYAEGARDQPDSRLRVERAVFQAAFAVFCIALQEREDLVEHYGVDPARVVVVGRPVASSFLRPAHDERGRPAPPMHTYAG